MSAKKIVPIITLALVLSVAAAGQVKRVDSGRKLWANIHADGYLANDMAIDRAGNVYEVGYNSDSEPDSYSLIKFDNNGNQKWVRYFRGPGSEEDSYEFTYSEDLAPAIALDDEGNVYVAGVGLSSDKENTAAGNDLIIVKYGANGQRKWTRHYGDKGQEVPKGIAIDDRGDIYVAGSASEVGGGVITIKYDAAGNRKWVRHNSRGDWLIGVSVDRESNVYLAGGRHRKDGDTGMFALKYDANGRLKWVKRENIGVAYLSDMALDDHGNTYISAGGLRGFTIKYDTAGRLKWIRKTFPRDDPGISPGPIAVDGNGNAYVAGEGTDSFVKFDRDGNRQWVKRRRGPGSLRPATGPTGDVYIAGSAKGRGFSIKYDSQGNRKWIKHVRGFISAMALDDRDNFYVTGSMGRRNHGSRYFTIKYSR